MGTGRKVEPRIVGFLCNWCCYAGADLCGVSRFQYPPNIRIIRLMCSGRVDPMFVIRAFEKGADGVFIGGCWPGECHYITEGNYDALSMMHLYRKILEQIGVNPERLRLEWVSASQGIRFAEVVTDFTYKVKAMGPLTSSEGTAENRLNLKLEALRKLVPYIKLVERERLRVRFETQEEYDEFFASEEFDHLFRDLIVGKVEISQIILLLQKRPHSAEEISEVLGLSPSIVSRHLNWAARRGFVTFDESRNLIAKG